MTSQSEIAQPGNGGRCGTHCGAHGMDGIDLVLAEGNFRVMVRSLFAERDWAGLAVLGQKMSGFAQARLEECAGEQVDAILARVEGASDGSVLRGIEVRELPHVIGITDEQRVAVQQAIRRRYAVLNGGAYSTGRAFPKGRW